MDKVFLFDTDTATARAFTPLHPRVLRNEAQLEAAFSEEPDALWIAFHSHVFLRALSCLRPRLRTSARLLMLDRSGDADYFRSIFERVVVAKNGFLAAEELVEVLSAPNAADLFIGGSVDAEAGVLLLFRGNLVPLVVPLGIFKTTPVGLHPDPGRFAIADYGQTVKLGDYEATADAILYEVDPDYRRRINQRRRAEEKTFGASLRRLRVQRGLRQSDFSGISEKEIGRIERGEVEQPRGETLKKIAKRLGVPADEIAEF